MRKRWFLGLYAAVAVCVSARADGDLVPASAGEAALAAAGRNHQYLFLLFWKEDDEATRAVRQALNASLPQRAGKARAAAVQVRDPAEKPLVDHYAVSRSPMPLVLAVAPNGAVTGAFPLKLTAEDVARAFVSPGQESCLKVLQSRKLAVLCVLPAAGGAVPEGVREFQADPRFGPATEVVTLRAGDVAEAAFLETLRIDPRTAVPVTVLFAPPVRQLGTFPGAVGKQQLVDKVTAPQGCCPGGKCGPGGCCCGGKAK